MPKRFVLNFTKYLSVFMLVFFCGGMATFAKENSSVNIENRVSATAKTGGNTISDSGTIKTGDASATVQAMNYANGEEKVEIKAEAETQGAGSQASVEVNGEKQTCTAENEAGCRVEMSSGDNLADAGSEVPGAETTETAEEPEKNITQSIYSHISDLALKIINWFL